MRLSGGQRRRVAIARALLKDAPYLLLDEPTVHLDPALADAIMQALLERSTGQGVLLLTHDLSHLDNFDEILVLDEGQVLERGTPRELIAMDGYFSHM
jgi:ABC-type transport system involved in cytochrome bd biosynthesis fused ATPase/permease subunit